MDDEDKSVDEIIMENTGEVVRIGKSIINHPIRTERPDLTFLVDTILVVGAIVGLYYSWPYMFSSDPILDKGKFISATKLSSTDFTAEEVAKVQLSQKSFSDYRSYFKSEPYSSVNAGVQDLMLTIAILPIVLFFIQFVLPPILLAYISWFVFTYWPYVRDATWGWFLLLYTYFTDLIQGRLGCKWYIRMVTGWSCKTPDFSEYYNDWRRTYIDRPVYKEQMKRLKTYNWFKRNYITKPYVSYILIPLQKLIIFLTYVKRLYIDRTLEILLDIINNSSF